MTPRAAHNEAAANSIIKGLKKRNMAAWYCPDTPSAREKLLALLPEGSSVSWGGSMTLSESGLLDAVKKGPYRLIDRAGAETPAEAQELMRQALFADVFLTSSNAITRSGELVNIDGRGNRVAALCFGPKSVVVVVGMNKVVENVTEGFQRIANVAAPINCQRLSRETPCATTGFCGDCYGESSICSSLVVTRRSHERERIKVILVGQPLGY